MGRSIYNPALIKTVLAVAFPAFLAGCQDTPPGVIIPPPVSTIQEDCIDLGDGWSLPKTQIYGGGVGKDGIPAIENPVFINASEVDWLMDEELVSGIKVGGEYLAFPQRIMDRHEIANGEMNGEPFSMTFCPLTGTALGWRREADNTFGVSGFLHNANLITYDRKTDSFWSQIYSQSINGPSLCSEVSLFPGVETLWSTWKALYPESKVLSRETGFNRNYNPPASFYQPETGTPLFPVFPEDDRLSNYERVLLVVVNDVPKVYRQDVLQGNEIWIRDSFGGESVIVVGSASQKLMVPIVLPNDEPNLTVEFDGKHLLDSEGNTYDLFGDVIEGPDEERKLEIPYNMMGYWFAIGAFYPNVEIYDDFRD